MTPFPVSASKYSALHPVSGGGLVWLRWPISGALGETFANPADMSGRPTLEHFNITKARRTELVGHLDWFAVSGDATRLVVMDEGELRAVPATEVGDSDSTVYLDLRRILHEVDPAAEWRQAYEEGGRIIRSYFWDPDMCGIDWTAVLDQYRPLVERVASPDEFADLMREVLGELGTSHAYVTPARRNEGPPHYQRAIGLLGANLVCRDGDWTIRRILPGDSSDSKARSPLAGTGIREGAVLTHVDGRPVDPVAGPYPLLTAAGGTTVELTFRPAGGGSLPRRVAVVPLVDERPLRYQDWVAKRREVVRELSGGKCGYLHIPDMGGSGWAQFNRDLRMEVSRPALIVDVRGNAGGHISELVVEKLTRTILGWDLTRNAQPVSYASNAPRGPVVALADEATSSDGDMITAAFRLLKLGPVVGQRTWGGVVGMTGRTRLGDGTVITVPMNAAWFDTYGWSIENHGVEPDLETLRTPSTGRRAGTRCWTTRYGWPWTCWPPSPRRPHRRTTTSRTGDGRPCRRASRNRSTQLAPHRLPVRPLVDAPPQRQRVHERQSPPRLVAGTGGAERRPGARLGIAQLDPDPAGTRTADPERDRCPLAEVDDHIGQQLADAEQQIRRIRTNAPLPQGVPHLRYGLRHGEQIHRERQRSHPPAAERSTSAIRRTVATLQFPSATSGGRVVRAARVSGSTPSVGSVMPCAASAARSASMSGPMSWAVKSYVSSMRGRAPFVADCDEHLTRCRMGLYRERTSRSTTHSAKGGQQWPHARRSTARRASRSSTARNSASSGKRRA